MTNSGFYGSKDEKTINIGKFLGSLDTRAKSIRKLYGSVDGKARIIGRFHISHPHIVVPIPVIKLTQNVYESSSGKSKVAFDWSKGITMDIFENTVYYKDEASENITYEILDGTSVIDHGTLAENTNGEAKQGTKSLTLTSGHKITIRITNTLVSGLGSETAELVFYTAVANAIITSPVSWDAQRHIVNVTANADGAASVKMSAGYWR